MLSWPWTRGKDRRRAEELYGAIVAQARAPAFFRVLGIEDTPEGRAEAIMLHLFLVIDRLAMEGEAGSRLGRHLTEAFVTDVDDCLREMGVGDLSVPKTVKRAAAGLYERCQAYGRALSAPGDALAAELEATVPGLAGKWEAAALLAAHMRRSRAHLAALDANAVLAGRIGFPDPDACARGRVS